MYHYSFLTLAVYLAQFLGGFLGDFLLGSTRGILLGFGIAILGAAMLSVDDVVTYYFAVFLIACGTGFSRANTFSFIAHFTQNDPIRLEKRFIAMYGFLNLGAFVSAIVIGLIAEYYGYFYSFLLILFLYLISFGLVFILWRINKTNTAKLPMEKNKQFSTLQNTTYLILAIVASAIFWMFFEMYSSGIFSIKMDYLLESEWGYSISEVFLFSSTGVALILIIPYYFLAKYLSIYVKSAIALILIGGCWALSLAFFQTGILEIGVGSLLVFAFFESIADIFFTPASLTLVAKHGRRRYYGLIFSVYSISIYLSSRFLSSIEASHSGFLYSIPFIVLLIASIVLFFLLPYLFKSSNSKSTSLSDL